MLKNYTRNVKGRRPQYVHLFCVHPVDGSRIASSSMPYDKFSDITRSHHWAVTDLLEIGRLRARRKPMGLLRPLILCRLEW